MKSLTVDRYLIYGSVIAFSGMSASIAAMALPNVFQDSESIALKYYTGTLFWAFAFAALVIQVILTVRRRRRGRRSGIDRNQKHPKGRVGLFSLPRTVAGLIALLVFAVSLIVIILLMLFHALVAFQLVDIAVILLSVCLHSVFDGKIWNEMCGCSRRSSNTTARSKMEERKS